MITTITLNPAIDRTIIIGRFSYGSVNKAISSREDMGGKGINVARVLKTFGRKVIATGFLGQQNIDHADLLLKRDHLDHDMVMVDAATRINTKLADRTTGTTTEINEPGFKVSEADYDRLKAKVVKYCKNSKFAIFSGSIPAGLNDTVYQDLIQLVPQGCKPILDADGKLLLQGMKASPFLIKPNIHELENALGKSLPDHAAIVQAASQLISEHSIPYVLVSMGGDGSLLVSDSKAIHAESLPVQVKGTVGAGDTMLAAFVDSLSSGDCDEKALAYANAAGALAVSNAGTQSINQQEMIQLASQVKLSIL